MRKSLYLILVFITLCTCKQEPKIVAIETTTQEISVAQRIANAHGFNNWDNVSKIEFTFNVDRDTSHYERSWTWEPKTQNVVMMTKRDTVAYNTKQPDSTRANVDRGFINDKYWLLIPFQLV